MYLSISDLAKKTEGVITAAGIKKAAVSGRIRARKNGRSWSIDTTDDTVSNWIVQASASAMNESDLLDEVKRLRRENANLAKRCRQAEAARRRAERELAKARSEQSAERLQFAESQNDNLQRIYALSQQRDQDNAHLLLRVAHIMANGSQQIIEASPVIRQKPASE